MAREGSKKGKHKIQFTLMTYFKKTSYIGQGIDHLSLFDLVCVLFVHVLHTMCGHKKKVKQGRRWAVMGDGSGK